MRDRKTGSGLLPCVVMAAALWLWASGGALAQDTELEYEWGEGLHQEEWYDPSDWFDTDAGIDYETDWWDYTYGYNYYDPYAGEGLYGYYGYYDWNDDDLGYDYNYYTDRWYEEGPYEDWYEE